MLGQQPAGVDFTPCAQSYLPGSFGRHAARPSQTPSRLWRPLAHALRRDVSPPALFQPPPPAEAVDGGDPGNPAQPPLQRGRDVPRSAVPDHLRPRTDRDGAAPPAERGLPGPHRAPALPRRHHTPPLPPAGGAARPPEAPRAARSTPAPDDPARTPAHPIALRRRLDRPGRLRPTGTRTDRVQPAETRTTRSSASRARAGTSGTGSSGRAMRIQPAGPASCSRLASRRSRPASGQ